MECARRLGRWTRLLWVPTVLALFAVPAAGTSFTLAAPVTIDGSNNAGSGVFGTLLPVGSDAGTVITLGGAVDGSIQDLLLVQLALDAGSALVDQVMVSVVGVSTVLGAGHFADTDETPTGGSVSESQALIDYDHLNVSAANLEAGETSDRLIASFTSGALPGPGLPPIIPPGTATIGISSGANFNVSASIVQVPEPSLVLLALTGVLLVPALRLG